MSSFWRKKELFYVILKVSEPSIHWLRGEISTAELSDFLMNGYKRSVYQVPNTLFTNQSSEHNCHKMANCKQFRTECCVKITTTLTVATTDVFFDKNVTMLQQEGTLSVEKKYFFHWKMLKFCDFILLFS